MTYHADPPTLRPATAAEATVRGGGAAAVLDAQALARLADLDPGGRNGLVQRVLSTYAQSLQRLLEQLKAARQAGDSEAVRHAAHTLKSSSASVGALALSALCADVEARTRAEAILDRPALDAQVDRLLAEAERIRAALATATK
jgi:HPt (histidine-containing phosphotransfer) domain-containing protein